MDIGFTGVMQNEFGHENVSLYIFQIILILVKIVLFSLEVAIGRKFVKHCDFEGQ